MATTCRLAWGNIYHIEKKAVYWNEVCAWAVERFGLPGDKFLTNPNESYMDFIFKDDEDATMFSLMWNAEMIPEDQLIVELVGAKINGF
jgi:hypothetical protein